MIKRSIKDIQSDIVREPGAKQTTLKRLIDTPDGADRFVMTLFHIEPQGSTPPHYHDWEHEIVVLEGSCQLQLPKEEKNVTIEKGDVVFIPRNEPHGFTTSEGEECKFIVVAPTERPPIHNYFLSEKPYEYTSNK
ncbi:cupin domain-containing protein [Priestia endophytica]|uniref:cupin domain-containing protein n=1 Tax=Priestia endophytica TaxID=135735 RepID=UPI002281891C|nr:cupin domain-containing protein [Priestia endophytica]MCY8235293.1 cupin domain-containing protein [Priestia endophytica]